MLGFIVLLLGCKKMTKETILGITYGEKYCLNCKKDVTPKARSLGLTILGVLLFIPAFLFLLAWMGGSGFLGYLAIPSLLISIGLIAIGEDQRCPVCNSKNWGEKK